MLNYILHFAGLMCSIFSFQLDNFQILILSKLNAVLENYKILMCYISLIIYIYIYIIYILYFKK